MNDYVTESAETLAEALCARWSLHQSSPVAPVDRPCRRCRNEVAALIAAGAVRPAAEVRAEAWDEGAVWAMRQNWHREWDENGVMQASTYLRNGQQGNPYRAARRDPAMTAAEPIIRYATLDDGTEEFDEFIAHNARIHLERMGEAQWWLMVTVDGRDWHLNIGARNTRAKGYGRCEEDAL